MCNNTYDVYVWVYDYYNDSNDSRVVILLSADIP